MRNSPEMKTLGTVRDAKIVETHLVVLPEGVWPIPNKDAFVVVVFSCNLLAAAAVINETCEPESRSARNVIKIPCAFLH